MTLYSFFNNKRKKLKYTGFGTMKWYLIETETVWGVR